MVSQKNSSNYIVAGLNKKYMTAMADAAIQKITEIQQAAQCHNAQISKLILTQDNAQKGKIKKAATLLAALLLL